MSSVWGTGQGDPVKNTLTLSERIERQLISARSLEPKIERILVEAIDENKSIVMEGVHLLPAFM